MAKKTLSREAKKLRDSEPKQTLTIAKKVVVKAAETVVEAVTQVAGAAKKHVLQPAAEAAQKHVLQPVADAAQKHVLQPVAEAVGIVKKPKKTRFVREKREKIPPTKAASLPARSTKAAAKMMSKNLKHAPQDNSAKTSKGHSPSKRSRAR